MTGCLCISSPAHTKRVQDQAIPKGQFLVVENNAIRILNNRITGEAPFLMLKNASAMLAGCLRCRLISVIPTGCGIYKHTNTSKAKWKQISAACKRLAAICCLYDVSKPRCLLSGILRRNAIKITDRNLLTLGSIS